MEGLVTQKPEGFPRRARGSGRTIPARGTGRPARAGQSCPVGPGPACGMLIQLLIQLLPDQHRRRGAEGLEMGSKSPMATLQPLNPLAALLLLSGDSEDDSEQCNLRFLPCKGPTGTISPMCKSHLRCTNTSFFSPRNLRLRHSPHFQLNGVHPTLSG